MDKLKIMVVDDESRMRKLVKDFLKKKDFEVIEAADGALDIIKIHGADIDRGVCDAIVGVFVREHIHPLELNKLVLGVRDFTAILGAGVIGKEPGADGGGQRAGRHG